MGRLLSVLVSLSSLAALVAGCTSDAPDTSPISSPTRTPGPGPERVAPAEGVTFVLLKNGQLVGSVPSHGRLIQQTKVANSRLVDAGFPLLAADAGRHRMYALTSFARGRDAVVVVDPARLTVTDRWQLPATVRDRAVVVGPRTGRLYLFGNRRDGKAETGPGQDALVTVVSPATGRVLQRWTVRRAGGRAWLVYAGGVSADERHLFLSYHGSGTTGIDVVTLRDGSHTRCRPKTSWPSGTACLATHGDFTTYRGQVLATTGEPQRLLKLTMTGKVLRTYRTKLKGNHLMEFAADLTHPRIWPIGPCGYTGGLSVINLTTGHTRVLVQPQARTGT
jgi:hypothetical protein